MASNSTSMHQHPSTYGSDPTSPNTTFVQADPSTFRAIVQQLTGASDHSSTPKLPTTHPNRPTATTAGLRKPAFKLHERRHSAKNLHIHLNTNTNTTTTATNNNNDNNHGEYHDTLFQRRQRNGILVSPVSPLDFFAARVSPRSPCEDEEERAIAEKGFYFHPSPLSTPRGADPPELLPLFPLHSPVDNEDHHNY